MSAIRRSNYPILGAVHPPFVFAGKATYRSRRRFTPSASGLPWNLTLADAAEEVWGSESSRSQVAFTDLDKVPAGRAPATVA